MKPAVRAILGQRIVGVLLATKSCRDHDGDGTASRLYLTFENGRHYEFWVNGKIPIQGIGGMDFGDLFSRIEAETPQAGVVLEAFLADPEAQRQADLRIAVGAAFLCLRDRPGDLQALEAALIAAQKRGLPWQEVYAEAREWHQRVRGQVPPPHPDHLRIPSQD